MKIGNCTPTAAPAPVSGGTQQTRTAETPREVTPPPVPDSEDSTSVQMSETASTLLDSKDQGGFDAEKVARLRQAVADGTYRVNAEAIADRLLANAQDLLGKIGTSSG
jgi:negative regulator of flagellin synthesis FlgM